MQIRAVCLFLSLWCMLFSAHACASAAEVLTSAELEEACRAMLDAAIASGSVRQPDAQLGYLWGGWLTMGQCLSFPLIIAGVCLLVWACKRKLPQQGLPD